LRCPESLKELLVTWIIETDAPEFTIDTAEVEKNASCYRPFRHQILMSQGKLRFRGRFVLTSTTFFSITLQPKKTNSVCEDVFDRILTFDDDVIFSHFSINFSSLNIWWYIPKKLSVQPLFEPRTSPEEVPLTVSQTDASNQDTTATSAHVRHFGCSHLADPPPSGSSISRKRSFLTGTARKVAPSSAAEAKSHRESCPRVKSKVSKSDLWG